ncbi:macro domain-containing protein [Anabaena azotica]|uniref:Macro domain-containing protein n=1 Tax=Anabaena azotica FACHB-119 TaxID=947527 RepID=A0ABR8DB03_9NOST|nr:macro domain-containing protein [Anabaena azotica]MBD2503638.1 macro domain-containing protein [Anabaena azotica FACHB-119]
MIPEISTISFLIGIIAGMIFYLDGWRASTGSKKLSDSQRYRGLLIVVGGGVVSPLLDKFILETDKYDFFKGYLFGVVFGWLILFISVTLLYVIWKSTKDLPQNNNSYRIGQISYSFIEIISGGINVDPIRRQQELENQIFENKLAEIKQKLRQEDPKAYVALEEQIIQSQQYALKAQKDNLETLKVAINQATSQPEQEAEKLIQDKNQLIQTLVGELELARNRYNENKEDSGKLQKIIDEYTIQLHRQENETRELRELINNFKNQVISESEFSKLITFKRINQYEMGGLFIGELAINGRLIKIYHGDITNLITDVVVSSDDSYLTMGGGVSYRIRCEGGNEIYTEAQKLVPLSLGEVVVTTAGKLSASKVFHGVVIDFDTGKGPSKEVIQQVIHTSLEKASRASYRCIAFPLLGTGAGGFSAIEALKIILNQIIKDLSNQSQSIVEVTIAIYGSVAQVIDIEAVIEEVKSNR